MKKVLLYSAFISLIIIVVAGVLMFSAPLPGGAGVSSPDKFIEKSYGFPLVFKTVQSGGLSGTTQTETNIGNLTLDLLIIAGISFVLSLGITSVVKRGGE